MQLDGTSQLLEDSNEGCIIMDSNQKTHAISYNKSFLKLKLGDVAEILDKQIFAPCSHLLNEEAKYEHEALLKAIEEERNFESLRAIYSHAKE